MQLLLLLLVPIFRKRYVDQISCHFFIVHTKNANKTQFQKWKVEQKNMYW